MKNNHINYQSLMSDAIMNVPKSFIREILKTAISPEIISLAGGLPNSNLFPVNAFQKAANSAFDRYGTSLFQYSNSEGFLPLRQWICERYKKQNGWVIDHDRILITNGSQQGVDLIGKVLINSGDSVLIEEPGYLGAIQSLSVVGAQFAGVPLEEDGVNLENFKSGVEKANLKLFYCVPAFQNPSGVLYSHEKIQALSEIVKKQNLIVVEDTPYKEIKFTDDPVPSFYDFIPEQTVLLGSFSKTTVPGMRIGWVVAPDALMERLIVAKQASDLHTDVFSQMILFEYLSQGMNEEHIRQICQVYSHQCNAMVDTIKEFCPGELQFVKPKGGMFLWVSLPKELSIMELFNDAIEQKVAFVPGLPFYTSENIYKPSMRLNFSCVDEFTIKEGIKRLGEIVKRRMLVKSKVKY